MRHRPTRPTIETEHRAGGDAVHTPLPQWALWSEVVIRVGWAAVAFGIWFVMSRRGHDGSLWALVGLVLGPIAVPAAILSARRAARRPMIVVADGASEADTNGVDVLAVVDPDDPSTWGVEAELLRTTSRVELAAVVRRDTMDHAARRASLRRARIALATVAAAIGSALPRQVILEGRPAAAVAQRRRLLGNPPVVAPSNRFGDHLRRSLAEPVDVDPA